MTQVIDQETTGTPSSALPPSDPPAGGGNGAGSGIHTGSAGPSASGNSRSTRRRWLAPSLLQLGAMVGIGALLYPSAADWFANLNHNAEISGYVRQVEALPDDSRLEKLRVAQNYNQHMPAGTLRDPYALGADNTDLLEDSAYDSYLQVLSVSDSGVIGDMSYPRLNISLPLYHGTSESVISKGVGHLYGSSLPVGGPSTHSVLTSHSGMINAALFTALPQAQMGDTFKMTVLGETHYYEVDRLETIEPFVTDALNVVPGMDYVTLITCTPIGINSHRYLVRGVRVEAPPADNAEHVIAGDGRQAGFPWWALGFVGGSALVAALLFIPPRQRRTATITKDFQNNTETEGQQ